MRIVAIWRQRRKTEIGPGYRPILVGGFLARQNSGFDSFASRVAIVRFIASNALAADLSSTLAMVCALAALALVRDPALWFKYVTTVLLGALNPSCRD
jgi:hypothetical protein